MQADLVERIEDALRQRRFETARRLCAECPAEPLNPRILRLLHEAHRGLSEMTQAIAVLDRMAPADEQERLEIGLLRAEDYRRLSAASFYAISREREAGLTEDQYRDQMLAASREQYALAEALATSDTGRQLVLQSRRRSGFEPPAPKPILPSAPPVETGAVVGSLCFQDGSPVGGVDVTLGLAVVFPLPDFATYLGQGMPAGPTPPVQEAMRCRSDAQGCFRFDAVPAGRHDFIAVSLDPTLHPIATRFVAHEVEVRAGLETTMNLTVGEWTSAPAEPVRADWSDLRMIDGVQHRRVQVELMRNPFYFDFPRQMVSIPATDTRGGLVLLDSAGKMIPHQVIGDRLHFFAALPARTDASFALYQSEGIAYPFTPSPTARLWSEQAGATGIEINTGVARFRVAGAGSPLDAAPLLGVCGVDGVWRGRGRWRLPTGVSILARQTHVSEDGPLLVRISIDYQLSNGSAYAIEFTAHDGEAYLLARETSPELDGAAFEFSLAEFAGGRGFLHWTSEQGNSLHWTDLNRTERELARLQESVAWWIMPCGFAYAMTAGTVASQDYIGVFTVQRGEWIDRKFERLAQGPGDDQRELDWPYPEMIGSTISMITAHTDSSGDAYFRFGLFDGERRWGVLVSTLEANDGPHKQLSAVQHKCSSPRLEDFKRWRLDEQDNVQRPSVVARRADLIKLRAKKSTPAFAAIWKRIESQDTGASAGLRFAVEGDPVIAWRKKLELVATAHLRSRMTLLGRDYADTYSPVGGRPITPWVEEYDLIAASGVFTPDEERLVRQFFMLMGHMFMETDFMNWRFNSRNANFEADRVDIVGAIGLAFYGNPDAHRFVEHATELMERSINIYCTPGSGKWYENPACYYLHASKCRMNLAFHLARHKIMDPTGIHRLKDFLRWGILLLTPPTPHSYDVMRDGLPAGVSYESADKVRRIPPIGDHAHVGPWVPDHYALLATLYRDKDPVFADLLRWVWLVGGREGGYFGNAPLVFAALSDADVGAAQVPEGGASALEEVLVSRRLEGFGAVFRGKIDRADEFYLLFKQGPGGYRYHRTEGSILLFANGRPLVYDGGEAGETWRHSTLSFHEAHMPLAAGHVERFVSMESMDFCQGVHPEALKPGDPVFLSDRCDHDLVDLAHARFAKSDPAVSRSVIWIKDEYVIVHDELDVPNILSHWNLQVVADSHEGDAANGYRFSGRFGTDLQVLLPGQSFIREQATQLPIHEYRLTPEQSFSMRHLQLTGDDPSHYLAVLRPLAGAQSPVEAQLLHSTQGVCGVRVRNCFIDDWLLFRREGVRFEEGGIGFSGRYGAVLKRSEGLTLVLIDGQSLSCGDVHIEAVGNIRVELRLSAGRVRLALDGHGTATISGCGQRIVEDVAGATRVRTIDR